MTWRTVIIMALVGIAGAAGTMLAVREAQTRRRQAEALASKLRDAENTVQSQTAQIDELTALQEKAKNDLKENRDRLSGAQIRIDGLQREVESSKAEVKESQSQAKVALAQVTPFRNLVSTLIGEMRSAANAKRQASAVRALAKSADQQGKKDSPEAVSMLTFLSEQLYINRGYQESQRAAGRTVAMLRALEPENLKPIVEALHQLGKSLYMAGRFAEAIPVLAEAADIGKNVDGVRSDAIREMLSLQVSCLWNLERESEAEPLHRQLVEMTKGNMYDRRNLAEFLTRQGQLDEAEQLWRDVHKKASASDGDEAPLTFDAQCGLAWVLWLKGDQSELETLHEDLIAHGGFRAAVGEPIRSSILPQYLFARGDLRRAEEYFLEGYRKPSQRRGPDQNVWLKPLVLIYEQRGETQKAESYRSRMIMPTVGDPQPDEPKARTSRS